MPTDLPKQLRILSTMIASGEKISWGSDTSLMQQAATEIERLRKELRDCMPVDAVRSIVVEAIRDATGCPDIKGQDGEYLVDKIEALARAIACA